MASNLLSIAALFVALLVLGCSVGWIVGLSVSPVVGIVVSSVTAAAATAVAGFQGSTAEDEGPPAGVRRRFAVIPLAIYAAGLAVGATVGMHERTGIRLGANPKFEIDRWVELGAKREVIVQRLFDANFPPTKVGEGEYPPLNRRDQVLFTVPADACSQLNRALDYGNVRFMREVRSLTTFPEVEALVALYPDTTALKREVRKLCEQ